ncbi:MAG: hypothetical protein IJ935_03220 [Afipia sp.]|nr:hypothetical protein [Afipia sp.]
MASAPFCAADENDIVFVKARVVGNFGDWLQVEFVGGNQVTKVFVGAGDVVTTIPDRVADAAMRYQIASLRRSHTR